ncbi:hypothetical protein OC844_004168 [Tilletia horrida]|nr:hypothetical protein OC844_004168 [Tilletia horrida]
MPTLNRVEGTDGSIPADLLLLADGSAPAPATQAQPQAPAPAPGLSALPAPATPASMPRTSALVQTPIRPTARAAPAPLSGSAVVAGASSHSIAAAAAHSNAKEKGKGKATPVAKKGGRRSPEKQGSASEHKRLAWDKDAPPGGKSSLDVLIRDVVKGFTEAEDWLAQTGQGRLDDAERLGVDQVQAEEKSIMDYVRKRWPYYDDLLPVLKDRAAVKPAYSHSTGDARDPAKELLLERAAAGGHALVEANHTQNDSPEVFYEGWSGSEDERNDKNQSSAPMGGDTSSPTAAITSSGGPSAASSVAKPATSAGNHGRTIGKGKQAALQKQSKKRMSAVEKGIDKRGNKRLKMEKKRQEFEMKNIAFERISARASQLENSGLAGASAFATATAQYKAHMKSFKIKSDDELSQEDEGEDPTDEDEDSD